MATSPSARRATDDDAIVCREAQDEENAEAAYFLFGHVAEAAHELVACRMHRRCKMADENTVSETLGTIAEKITALSASVDKRFGEVDKRFDEVSEAFVEQRKYTEFAFERLQTQLRSEMRGGFDRLDRKLDRVLSAVSRLSPPRRRRRS